MSPDRIGRYEIVEELGRGGMGVVYRAMDPTIRRVLALKTLRLDSQAEKPDEVLKRFRHEAQLAGGMNHPNIVTIYDAGDDGPIFYIAMEFIEGRTLQAILLEQRLTIEQIITVARQICSALDYAHVRGVVHRDIKPANIMGASLGALKIMDFGIAKSDLGLTMTGQILGTPAYMSPEQVMGRPLDGRSDLFSFAVILYQMVTGEMPFAGNTATTIIYKIANEHPVAPSDLDVTIHPGLSAVVTKALSKNPDERFQTGGDLVKALENYKSQPVAKKVAVSPDAPTVTLASMSETTRVMPASPTPAGRVVAPPQKRNHAKWGVLALLGIAALAAAGYFAFARQRQPEPPVAATSTSQPATPQPTRQSEPKTEATPAEAKPAPEFAELHITSEPAGAAFAIDGKSEDKWVTPYTAKRLSPGEHKVAFTLQDYISQTKNIRLAAGQQARLKAELVMSGGNLVLNSDPAGAVIFIDGAKQQGQNTPAQVHVTAGQHRVMLRLPGYQEENTTVDIKDGETYPYSPTLERGGGGGKQGGKQGRADQQQQPNSQPQQQQQQQQMFQKALAEGKGILAFFSQPQGADIQVNGRKLPKPTPFRIPIVPGQYHVTISLDGYNTIQRDVTVEAGKPTRIQVQLQPR